MIKEKFLCRPRRRKFTTFICVLLFLLGVPMVTKGGAYVFQLMDFYSASGIPILWCCFFQTIAIGWIFGKCLINEQLGRGLVPTARFWPPLCYIDLGAGIL